MSKNEWYAVIALVVLFGIVLPVLLLPAAVFGIGAALWREDV